MLCQQNQIANRLKTNIIHFYDSFIFPNFQSSSVELLNKNLAKSTYCFIWNPNTNLIGFIYIKIDKPIIMQINRHQNFETGTVQHPLAKSKSPDNLR